LGLAIRPPLLPRADEMIQEQTDSAALKKVSMTGFGDISELTEMTGIGRRRQSKRPQSGTLTTSLPDP